MVRVAVLEWGVAPAAPPPINWQGEHPAGEDRREGILAPNWADIKRAIRRLDGRRYRSVVLWPSADKREHWTNGEFGFLSVIGGDGLYVVTACTGGHRPRHLYFPEWPDREVIVLPGPWGYVDGVWAESARRVCRDVEMVLQAARYYAEHTDLDPSLPWEPNRAEPGAAPGRGGS